MMNMNKGEQKYIQTGEEEAKEGVRMMDMDKKEQRYTLPEYEEEMV